MRKQMKTSKLNEVTNVIKKTKEERKVNRK